MQYMDSYVLKVRESEFHKIFTFNCQKQFQANSYFSDVYIILVKYIFMWIRNIYMDNIHNEMCIPL